MVDNCVLLYVLVRGVDSPSGSCLLRHRQSIINPYVLSDILQNVVQVENKDHFSLGEALLEELLGRQVNPIGKQINENKADAFVELHVRHEL